MKLSTLLLSLVFIGSLTLRAQVHPDFMIIKSIPTTPVKNQANTGTCWCFGTISFLETEALRLGKPALDLSEMYIVKNAYADKARKYIKYHGKTNFSQGGQAHDVLNVVNKHGLIPEESYNGLNYGTSEHNHEEMISLLQGMLKGLLNSNGEHPSPAWLSAFNACIETYLGKAPAEFKYQKKNYTPQSFTKDVAGINPDDYVEITSYKDYPYYELVDLEIPDNWSHDRYYNVPAKEFMQIIDYSLNNGYSVVWDGDISEDDFNAKGGTAVLSLQESDGIILNGIEKMRQESFDNFSTTDDHLMHITGLAQDKNGAIFYLTKNSWGSKHNKYGGYLYLSKWYVQLKTIAIMVNKNALPKEIRKKLKI